MQPAGSTHACLALWVLCLLATGGCQEPLPERACITASETTSLRLHSESPHGKRVFVVQSYHAAYPWTAAIGRGIDETLQETDVLCKTYFMDTKRRTDVAWKEKAGAAAMETMKSWNADVVIAADDNAQQYFGRHLVDSAVPLVFCGVNVDPARYGYPARNVTGIIERPMLGKSLALARRFFPVQRLLVLSSNDPTSRGAIAFMKEQYVNCDIEFQLVGTLEQWLYHAERANRTADALAIYQYHTLSIPGQTQSVDPGQVMTWTTQYVDVPTIAFFRFGVTDGCLLGVVASGEEHGRRAAQYALAILRGDAVNTLPVVRDRHGAAIFNYDTANRLEVSFGKDDFLGVEIVGKGY